MIQVKLHWLVNYSCQSHRYILRSDELKLPQIDCFDSTLPFVTNLPKYPCKANHIQLSQKLYERDWAVSGCNNVLIWKQQEGQVKDKFLYSVNIDFMLGSVNFQSSHAHRIHRTENEHAAALTMCQSPHLYIPLWESTPHCGQKYV